MPSGGQDRCRNGEIGRQLCQLAVNAENRRRLRAQPQLRPSEDVPDRFQALLRRLDEAEH